MRSNGEKNMRPIKDAKKSMKRFIVLRAIERMNAVANLINIRIRDKHVHRKHYTAPEEVLRLRKVESKA